MIGVLGGSYNVTALSRLMMFDDAFNGEGHCLITDKDGKAIACDRVYTDQELEGFFANIFEYFDNYMIKATSIQKVKADFADGKTVSASFS